jgi:hypothetical protein
MKLRLRRDVMHRKDTKIDFLAEKKIGKRTNPIRIYSIPIGGIQKRLFKEKSLQSDSIVE